MSQPAQICSGITPWSGGITKLDFQNLLYPALNLVTEVKELLCMA